MITDILTYTLHIAPSLAVVLVLLWQQNKRLTEIEDRIQVMLDECWHDLLNRRS